ncbi:MAG: hypothetical protein R2876_01035 [Eubacteriales bacterium]
MPGNGNGGRLKTVKFWTLKIFFITLILAAAFSFLTEYFMNDLNIIVAVLLVLLVLLIGVAFDIIGIAFATCDKTPFVAMASKKVKGAKNALMLLKNATSVSNFCNDVIGDICGIVSGAAGAAIAVKIILISPTIPKLLLGIAISSFIAAMTVSLKSAGKKYAVNKNKQIVQDISKVIGIFSREK